MIEAAIIASVFLAAAIGAAVGYVVGHGRGVRSGVAADRRRTLQIFQEVQGLAMLEDGDELAARRNRLRGQHSAGPGGAA